MNNNYISEFQSDLNSQLAEISNVSADMLISHTKRMMTTVVEYKELMMMYTCAIKEVKTKFEVLNTEFNVRHSRNPISSITTRLKHTNSIVDKLDRKGLDFNLENIEKNINDVAGIRIVCSYADDIYMVADALLVQDDITLISKKDYIANPKPNGYRSLHLIVEVPVFFAQGKRPMKVEVQIRTIAMDFWASLEHQLKYKRDIPNQNQISEELKQCAETIAATDEKMLKLRSQIELAEDIPSDDDILAEKLEKLDLSID